MKTLREAFDELTDTILAYGPKRKKKKRKARRQTLNPTEMIGTTKSSNARKTRKIF